MPHPLVLELTRLAGLPDSAAAIAHIAGTDPVLPTPWRVAETGAAAIAAAGVAACELWTLRTGQAQTVRVDARAAAVALRSARYLRIDGHRPAGPGDAVTGFYRVKGDRWIYLHCNFFNLRERNLRVLGAGEDPASVSRCAADWDGLALEEALFEAGGCGALVRSEAQWNDTAAAHAVRSEPLMSIVRIDEAPPRALPAADRPLAGVRVLDLTRVLAGPTAARTLAEHGADVLRLSCPGLADSGSFDLDTGLGKLSATLDLREPAGVALLRALAAGADVFSQSYRPGALAARGFSPEALAALRPGIVCLTLDAWGYSGPWKDRRGFDTVVQSANGMAFAGDEAAPVLMPVSAQDYIAGYLMAYGAMVALRRRATEGGSWLVRLSLAGVGEWLRRQGTIDPEVAARQPKELPDEELRGLMTQSPSPVGLLTHLAPVAQLSHTPGRWTRPAVPLGSHPPEWP